MAELIREAGGLPKPQFENEAGTSFEAHKGKEGAAFVYVKEGHNISLGKRDDVEATEGDGTLIAILKNVRTRLITLTERFNGTQKLGNVDVANLPTELDRKFGLTKDLGNVTVTNMNTVGAKVGSLHGAISVDVVAVEIKVGVTALANRKAVVVHNNSAADIFIGYNNTVTTTTGLPIKANTERRFDVLSTEQVTLFGIAAAAADVRVLEIL